MEYVVPSGSGFSTKGSGSDFVSAAVAEEAGTTARSACREEIKDEWARPSLSANGVFILMT